jgi:MFS family permease
MKAGFAVGWRQVAACLVLMAVSAMVASTYSIVAVPLAREFHPSRMVLMLAMTVMTAGAGLMAPILGPLMDRMSLRRLMALGCAMLVAGFVALSFATSFLQVIVIYGLFMAAANILMGPMPAMVLLSRWFVGGGGTAMGLAISGVAFGAIIFPPIIQGLLDGFPWREAMRLLALILAVCSLPAVTLISNSPADKGLHPDGAPVDPVASEARPDAPHLSAREVLTDPAFWMVGAMIAVVLSGMLGLVTNIVPLALDHQVDPNSAALLISIYAATGFVGKLTFAAVSDRLNLRHLALLVLGLFGSGMVCLLWADGGYWMIALGVGLVGFGGVMIPLQGLLVPRIFGLAVIGRVSGYLNTLVLCTLLATPPIFGGIFDLTGSYSAGFMIFAALTAGAMLMAPYIRLHPRGAAPEAGRRDSPERALG